MGLAEDFLGGKKESSLAEDFLSDTQEQEPSLLRRAVVDPAISLVKGAIGLPEAAIGLADIVSGGRAGKAAQEAGFDTKKAKGILDEFLSAEQHSANREVSDAEGFLPTIEEALSNPSTIGHTILESAPSMLGGATVARGLMKAAPSVSPVIAGAAGEGVVGAGMSAEQIRQATDDGLLTPEQSALAGGSGALTGLLGAAGGKVAQKLGITDVDTLLAGGTLGPASRKMLPRRVIEGMIAEGALEELPQSAQEQIMQNLALGDPWDKGVPESAAMGFLAGAGMGGGFAAINRRRDEAPLVEDIQDEEDQGGERQGLPNYAHLGTDPMIVFPDGSTATRAEFEQYINSLPENERAGARARMMGMGSEDADVQAEPHAIQGGALTHIEDDPLIAFPDGSVGRRAEVDAFVASLPEGERASMRARLMGLGQQDVVDEAVKKAAGGESRSAAEDLIKQALNDVVSGTDTIAATKKADVSPPPDPAGKSSVDDRLLALSVGATVDPEVVQQLLDEGIVKVSESGALIMLPAAKRRLAQLKEKENGNDEEAIPTTNEAGQEAKEEVAAGNITTTKGVPSLNPVLSDVSKQKQQAGWADVDINEEVARARDIMRGERPATKADVTYFNKRAASLDKKGVAEKEDKYEGTAKWFRDIASAIDGHLKQGSAPKPASVESKGSEGDSNGIMPEASEKEVVAKAPSEKQIAQRNKLKRQARERRMVNSEDTMNQAIIKLGGIHDSLRLDLTGESKGNANLPFVGSLFNKKGTQDLSDLANQLGQYNYFTEEELNDVDGGAALLSDRLRSEFNGADAHRSLDADLDAVIDKAMQDAYDEMEERARIEAEARGLEFEGIAKPEDLELNNEKPSAENLVDVELVAKAIAIDPIRADEIATEFASDPASFMEAIEQFIKDSENEGIEIDEDREADIEANESIQENASEEDIFGLEGQSEEELAAAAAEQEKADKEAKRKSDAEEKVRKDASDKKEIDQRGKNAAVDFVLGGNAIDELAGQKDIFSQPAQKPETKFQNNGEGLNQAEKELRSLSHDKEADGDVLLGNGKYVSFDDAVRLATEAIKSGQINPVPFQINSRLDITMRDVDRVLDAAKKRAPVAALKADHSKPQIWHAGRSDFEEGKPRIPPSYISGNEKKRGWLAGWDAANVAAQAPESKAGDKPTTYFKGDLAEYTGKVETIHGGTFYEVKMMEGADKGKMKVVKQAPPKSAAEINEIVEANKPEIIRQLEALGVPSTQIAQAEHELKAGDDTLAKDLLRINTPEAKGKEAFTYNVEPVSGGFILESKDGGGTVLSRKPRGPAMVDPVPPKVFNTRKDAEDYANSKGMALAAPKAASLDELKQMWIDAKNKLSNQDVEDDRLRQKVAMLRKAIDEGEAAQFKEKAKQDLDDALADLADIFGKPGKMNLLPEQEQKLMPVLARVMDAALRMGFYKFKDATRFVLKTIKDKLGVDVSDQLTIDHLQGAYISMAGKYKDQGADSKKDVVAIESLDEIGEDSVKTDTIESDDKKDIQDEQIAASGPASDRPLEGIPPQDVSGVEGGGKAAGGGNGGGRKNSGRAGKPDAAGVSTGGSVGGGTGDLFVSAGGSDGRSGNDKPVQGGKNGASGAKQDSAKAEVAGDYRITELTRLGEGGAKSKYAGNIAAIRLMKDIRDSGRKATPEEQDILARYVGWGGIPQAFDAKNEDWSKQYAELKELLSQEEWLTAIESTQYAHYTSAGVIRAMYAAAEHLGFGGGKILEPGSGVGNFMGLMPDTIRNKTRFTGVERESIAGGIAKLLYPNQNIQQEDFTRFNAADGYYDFVIGNPPFANTGLTDMSGRKHLSGLTIHNYFFAKSIDMLREGGILMQVVTSSFLDANKDKARTYISKHAKLVGAIRLPNSAFMGNAGTDVTTDIIFLQKLPESKWNSKEANDDAKRWLGIGQVADPRGGEAIPLNQYFVDNPHMMLGRMERVGGRYHKDMPGLIARDGNMAMMLAEAIGNLPANIYVDQADAKSDAMNEQLTEKMSGLDVEVNGYFVRDGKLYQRVGDSAGEQRAVLLNPNMMWTEKTQLGEKKYNRLVKAAELRTTLRHLIAAERNGDKKKMDSLRAKLNEQYDVFAKGGLINDRASIQLFGDDPDYPLLASLESNYDAGITEGAAKKQGVKPVKPSAKKSDIFTKSVVGVRAAVTSADSPVDALMISIAEHGRIDAPFIGKLLGRDGNEVLDELTQGESPELFVDPEGGGYVLRDEYLSGNVRKKLRQAEDAGSSQNARALAKVVPEDIPSHEITGRLAAPWIPPEVYEDFIKHLLGDQTKVKVRFVKALSSFNISVSNPSEVAETNTYGIPEKPATAIVEALLNNRQIQVRSEPDEDGKTVLLKDKTDEANDKAATIRDKFGDWLMQDADRAEKLARIYNDTMNNYVVRKFNGDFLAFPGKVPDSIIKFRRHQKNAIARGLQDGRVLLDHVVGSGKTYTVIGLAQELVRTGLAKKSMIAVPNHLVKQWAADYYRLYPGANILAATKKDFEKGNRRQFLARIATGNWDAVVIAHSSFGFIKADPMFEESFNNERINEIIRAIEELKSEDEKGSKRTIKQLAKMKERLEQRIKALRDKPMDALLDFGQLGIDNLFVDEAHMFKNLMYTTKMQNVRGLGQASGSMRAYDMLIKTRQIMASNGGKRGVVFATGTPISNSLAEMYHMMRYLYPDGLDDLGMTTFDAWANTFAEVEQVWMQSLSGTGYKATNRMSKFVNAEDLMKMWNQVADTVTQSDVQAAYREENNGKEFPLPKLKNGKRTPVSLVLTDAVKSYMGEIAERAKAVERRSGPPQKGDDNILSIMTDARKAAMDIRLVRPEITKRDPEGRIAVAGNAVYERYLKYNDDLGTQLIFSDMGTPLKSAKKELAEYHELQAAMAPLNDEETVARADLGDEEAMKKIADAEKAQEKFAANGQDWLDAIKAALRGFSIYDDMKAHLVELGIPEKEIAFIHDYNTDDQKAALFAAVNAGKIRVLMGSTAKMGAGTNVQQRLVALHHLDVPWKPSDIEQREGRIIRQGNLFSLPPTEDKPNPLYRPDFEIEINAYATQDTLDLFMWQVQEKKLAMINQLREGKVGREFDNAFEEMQLSAGEMQAAATSNPFLLEEIQLKDKIKKLERQQKSHVAQQNDLITRERRARADIKELPEQVEKYRKLTKAARAYEDKLEKREVNVTIDGTEYKDEFQAAEYLNNLESYSAENPGPKGRVTGLVKPVDINGKEYHSITAASTAFRDVVGDKMRIELVRNGETFIRRADIRKAVASDLHKALETDATVEMGSFGDFVISVTGEHGSGVIDAYIELKLKDGTDGAGRRFGRYKDLTEAANSQDNWVSAALYAMDAYVFDLRDAEYRLDRAKKTIADLGKTEKAAEWKGGEELEKARARHRDVLKQIGDFGKDSDLPTVSEESLILNQAEWLEEAGVPASSDNGKGMVGYRVYSQGLINVKDQPKEGFSTREKAQAWVDSQLNANSGGGVRTSRASETAEGMSVSDVKKVISKLQGAGLKRIHVAATAKDLPEAAAQKNSEVGGGVRGFYIPATDELWLVADQLNDEAEAIFTALHEATHRGLSKVFGQDIGIVLRQIWATNQNVKRETAAMMKEFPDMSREEAIEEVLADMARDAVAKDLKGWAKLVDFIRKWLADMGFIDIKFTDEMVEQLVAGAARAGLDDGPSGGEQTDSAALRTNRNAGNVFSQIRSAPFKKWFGKSKVVDKDGNPLRVYHGTTKDFSEFKSEKEVGGVIPNTGLYFSPSPIYAGMYAAGSDNASIYPVYLSIKNPLIIDGETFELQGGIKGRIAKLLFGKHIRNEYAANKYRIDKTSSMMLTEESKKELRGMGYDGIINRLANEIVAFDASQVKSAIGNNGDFDPTNRDIRTKRAPKKKEGPATSKYREQNRRFREEHITLWSKAKTWLKRQLSPGGLLPAQVFDEKIKRDSEFEVVEFDIKHLVGQLERAIKKDYKLDASELDEKVQRLMGEVMAGNISTEVPAATKVALIGMRQYIDSLSTKYLEALEEQANGLLAQAQATGDNRLIGEAKERMALYEVIMGNVGQYVHRSYKAFDDPNWARTVPDKVIDAAREYLIERNLETMDKAAAERRAEVVLNEMLKHGTAYDSMEAFIKESKLGAKDLSVLKTRKQIAPEIRALLGEYTDPRINFAKSATKMGRLIWNQKFLEKVREVGMGQFLFTDATKPPEATAKIAADASDAYAPLNGLWTFPEVDQAFKDALGKEKMEDWYRAVVKVNGMVKYGKTVLSPTTAARNWMSAFFFTVANGHFDMRHMAKSVDGLKEYFTHSGDAAKLAYLRKLKHLGVVYDTPYAGEMMRLLADSDLSDKLMMSKGKMKIKTAMEMATKFYQYGDDFWKIIGFENEKRMWMETGMPEAEAEVKAAKRIRDTYPTYSMVGKGIQSLRRFPLAGTFVSFPAEIIRTSYNMVKNIAEDYKNPKTRPMAIRRATGLAIASSFAYAAQALSMAAAGFDDDDEEAVRLMAAPWQRNANLFFTGYDDEGNIRYMDMSFLDPYNYFKRPIVAVTRGQPLDKAITDVFKETLTPFFGVDIAAGTLFEVLANKKETGAPVFRERDDAINQLADITNHMRKTLQPGILSNIERTYKAIDGDVSPSGKKYDPADEARAWFGFRMATLDPKVALYYRSFDFKDAKADAGKHVNDVIRRTRDVDTDDLSDALETTNRLRSTAYKEMHLLIEASLRSGMSRQEVAATLRNSGVSKDDVMALLAGHVMPWRADASAAKQQAMKARGTFGREGFRNTMSRYRELSALSSKRAAE